MRKCIYIYTHIGKAVAHHHRHLMPMHPTKYNKKNNNTYRYMNVGGISFNNQNICHTNTKTHMILCKIENYSSNLSIVIHLNIENLQEFH